MPLVITRLVNQPGWQSHRASPMNSLLNVFFHPTRDDLDAYVPALLSPVCRVLHRAGDRSLMAE